MWGSKRTGPDLAREGVLRPDPAWQYFHLLRPSDIAPGSPMPNYPWLGKDDMDLSLIGRKLTVLAQAPIYTPYSQDEVANAERDARTQAAGIASELRKQPRLSDTPDLEKKEIISVIAYLRRLGTDLGKANPQAVK